jgi:hypothetical protein
MPPFTPTYRNGQSAASLIVALAEDKPYDYIVSYEDIADQLGIEADDLARIRSGVARAKPRLQRDHMRTLECVPNKGYRIIRPGEAARVAMSHRKKSDRSIKRAIATVKSANEEDMTDAERVRNQRVGMALTLLHERQIDVESRVSRLEALMLGKGAPKVVKGEVVEPLAITSASDVPEESSGG